MELLDHNDNSCDLAVAMLKADQVIFRFHDYISSHGQKALMKGTRKHMGTGERRGFRMVPLSKAEVLEHCN